MEHLSAESRKLIYFTNAPTSNIALGRYPTEKNFA